METGVRRGLKVYPGSVASLPEKSVAAGGEFLRPGPDLRAGPAQGSRRIRVRLVARDPLVHEILLRSIAKQSNVEILPSNPNQFFCAESLLQSRPDLLLLGVSGSLDEDVALIRKVRNTAPEVHVVMFGGRGEEREFLFYVRAGVRGYLAADASGEEVAAGLLAVQAGRAFCPGSLCATLFRYFEREATTLPSAAMRQQLGLTRREQQLLPLIARGLTNKEIAGHFCLSEQTVKNHLYRMKHKVGADNRLGIVQTCHQQGFLL